MKITFVKQLTSCGKMQAARMDRMKSFGLWPLNNFLPAQRNLALPRNLLAQAKNLPLKNRLQKAVRNNIDLISI